MKYNLFCIAGLLVAFAYDDLSHNKRATQSHTAVGDMYDASNAVDGNPASCMRTELIGLISPEKTVWWKVDLGGVYNIYSINILFKNYDGYDNRQRGRLAGLSLYVSNTGDIQGASLCFKDGPQLPPLNFTCICTESGRFVIFYNERLPGVTYPSGYILTVVSTELCEVTVQGCNNASVYGINCDQPCPTNCKDNTCHIQSGACFDCKPGWTGVYCKTKCGEGWYGVNCTEQCIGHCRDNTPCYHVTGQCDGGCDAGWTGAMCDKGCDGGTYGYNCANNCSGHCLNGYPCNKQTGQCDSGCNPGYTNKDCNRACTKGYFGTNCSRICSPNCKQDTCRHTDGSCTSCAAGWMGHNCTTECALFYGENCKNPCNIHCIMRRCDKINGSCLYGCEDGEQCEKGLEEELLMKQNMPSCITLTIGLAISLLINLILIGFGISLCRRRKPSSVTFTGCLLFCWNKSVYQDTFMKTEEASTYQELDLSGGVYQNTTIR